MRALDRIDFAELRAVLGELGVDGWLIFDFHGVNPVARRLVGYEGMVTRRLFMWLPATGSPQSIVHTIDAPAVGDLPGEMLLYTRWTELHQLLEKTVGGKRAAMEISPEDAVPYLDRVPAGVIELLYKFGVVVTPSDELVTRFASRWSLTEVEDHRRAAEALARIAQETLQTVVGQVGAVTEYQVQRRVIAAMSAEGLAIEDPPIVAFGANAANPHHDPKETDERVLGPDEVVLLDLWGQTPSTVWADQTWMGFSGSAPPDEVVAVWEAVRDARDAAVRRLHQAHVTGEQVTGALLDEAARGLLRERGYGASFTHRTGHSIDGDIHGSGPHLDDFETNDIRKLVPGVVFSVEPGVYLKGRFGVRSEINVILGTGGPEVTPRTPQQTLIVAP